LNIKDIEIEVLYVGMAISVRAIDFILVEKQFRID